MFTTIMPITSAISVITMKYMMVRSARPPALARLPSPAMPTTIVQKIVGAMTIFTRLMNRSASHFSPAACTGKRIPTRIPAAIETSTQK